MRGQHHVGGSTNASHRKRWSHNKCRGHVVSPSRKKPPCKTSTSGCRRAKIFRMSQYGGTDQRYELVLEPFGRYVVWDIFEDRPADIIGFALIGLDQSDAEFLADLLLDDRVPNARHLSAMKARQKIPQHLGRTRNPSTSMSPAGRSRVGDERRKARQLRRSTRSTARRSLYRWDRRWSKLR